MEAEGQGRDWVGQRREALRRQLVDAGLGDIANAIVGLSRPSIRLEVQDSIQADLQLGVTALGGSPDLPAETVWPTGADDRPLSFLVQLNLQELSHLDPNRRLPAAGLLTFFYDVLEQPWGYDPRHAWGWSVVYTPPGTPLVRREAPSGLTVEGILHRQPLTPVPELSTPDVWTNTAIDALDLSDDARDRLETVVLSNVREPAHRLLGHPLSIQGPMELQCQLVSNGIYDGDAKAHQHPRFQELRDGAADWQLLLQIDSDENLGHYWGDLGRLYFWIREQDLHARAWERVWLILQCG